MSRINPKKKSKDVIKNNACTCGKQNCVLLNETLYKVYSNTMHLKYAQFGILTDSKFVSFNDMNLIQSQTISIKRDVFALSKCQLAKEYLKLCWTLEETMVRNTELKVALDRVVIEKTNIKTPAREALGELLETLKKNEKLVENERTLEDLLKLKNQENSSLRQEIRTLKHSICDMIPKRKEIEIYEEISEEEVSEESEEEEESETKTEGTLSLNICEIYEKVKSFLIKNNSSVSGIARRNNVRKTVINQIRDSFIKLKTLRIKLAHPESVPISTDEEFLNILRRFK